jgi:DNA-binding cell septation regulator SpoVG
MNADAITVELRLAANPNSPKVKAFADVTLPLDDLGILKLCGFSVVHGAENILPRVVPPARKGEQRYFDIVFLIGKIRQVVDGAVLAEYNRQVGIEGSPDAGTKRGRRA